MTLPWNVPTSITQLLAADVLIAGRQSTNDTPKISAASIASSLGPASSVKLFGAVGANTDDTAAIATAIAAVPDGGSLYFPPGTYLTTGTTINKSLSAWFAPGATLKLANGQPSAAKLLTITSSLVAVVGGIFDGNRDNQGAATGQDVIFCSGQSNIFLDLDQILNAVTFGFHGVDLTTARLRVRNGVSNTGDTGVQWEYLTGDLTDCLTYDTLVDQSSQAAFAACGINYTKAGSATGQILKCGAMNCETRLALSATNGLGIQLWGAGSRNFVENSRTEGGGWGISIANGQTHDRVNGNVVYQPASYGIELADTAFTTATGNVVDGNGVTDRGFWIDGTNIAAQFNNVTGNTVRGCLTADVYLFAGTYGAAGTVVSSNALACSVVNSCGVYNNFCSDIVISGNNIDGAGQGSRGVVVDTASRVSVSGNNIRNFTGQSVQILAQSGVVEDVQVSGGCWASTQTFQALPSGTGSFGKRISVLGVAGFTFGNCEHADVEEVAADGSYYTVRLIGPGVPEGVYTVGPGSEYLQTDGPAGATRWVKRSGTGNTGWGVATTGFAGATTDRPTLAAAQAGFTMFDTTVGKPIWWTGTGWVDATGATV